MTGSANPYVGPRPLERGERLYGRDRELRDLDNMLSAERIVLLHSPSGAGKSSLLQAGLLPRLRFLFDIWGPIRVNQEPTTTGEVNRYVLSALLGFQEGVPERLRRPPEELAGQTLAEFFDRRPRRRTAAKNALLVFDQFEEVLTVDPLALAAKREFFDQLGEVLRNPRAFALFALREDYLAPLDPYAQQVPSHLKNRLRIDLLGLDGARQAIANPARDHGREFPAAEQLANDLATRKVQQPDGAFVEQVGHHVEPVQLQVVCRRLWQSLPEDRRVITAADLEQFGDVNTALAGYYADSVARIAAGDAAGERAIREWFSESLIVGGIRSQVLRRAGTSGGLANELIEQLLDTHLVRGEERAGATWYELAHDRLIEPVESDNRQWRDEHLSEAQRRAAVWERQGRLPGLLLADDDLAAAERWAAAAPAITEVEEHFLDASRQAQAAADRERRQAQRIKRLRLAAVVVGLLAVALAVGLFAMVRMAEAERQRREALAQREEAERQRLEADRQRELEESKRRQAELERQMAETARREAVEQREVAEEQKQVAEEKQREARAEAEVAIATRDQAEQARAAAERRSAASEEERRRAERLKGEAERAETEARRLQRLSLARALTVRSRDLSRGGESELAALLALQALRLNRVSEGDPEDPELYLALRRSHQALAPQRGVLSWPAAVQAVTAVGPLPAGSDAAAAYAVDTGEIGLVRLGDAARPDPLDRFETAASAVAWSPATHLLAAASAGGALRIWDLASGAAPPVVTTAGPTVLSLAFHPAGERLAAGGAGVTIWDLASPKPRQLRLSAAGFYTTRTYGLAWSGDGTLLAMALGESGILLWAEGAAPKPPPMPDAQGVAAYAVAWSRDGRWLAVGRGDGSVALWRRAELAGAPATVLAGHRARVNAVAFHPERHALASASADGTLRLWDLERDSVPPFVLDGHALPVAGLAFSGGGERLLSAGADGTLRLWWTRAALLADDLCAVLQRDLSAAEWEEHLHADRGDRVPSCPPPLTER